MPPLEFCSPAYAAPTNIEFGVSSGCPPDLTSAVAVAAGGYHSLALLSNGTVSGVGNNDRGQLDFPPNLHGVRMLAANGQHSLAVIESGQVVAWGDNAYGQATPPTGFANPRAIACGQRHSLAVASDGTVAAWGDNGSGQCSVTFGLTNVFAVAGGGGHSLALVGPVPPFVKRPPLGTTVYANNPVELDAIVIGSEPLVYQWQHDGIDVPGANAPNLLLESAQPDHSGQYQLMISNAGGTAISSPAQVEVLSVPGLFLWDSWSSFRPVPAGLDNVIAVSGGGMHFLALLADGTVAAWGEDRYGVLDVPADLTDVVAIDAGTRHALALRRDGTVRAWGNPTAPELEVPAGLDRVVDVAAGYGQSLALREDGTVVGWGMYSIHDPSGTSLCPLRNLVDVAVGHSASAALMDRGTVLTWRDPSQAVIVMGPTNVIAIDARDSRPDLFAALHDDGTISQWSGDDYLLYRRPVSPVPGYTNLAAVVPGGTPLGLTHNGEIPGLPLRPESYHAQDLAVSALGSIALMGDGSPVIKVPPRPRWTWVGNTVTLIVKAVGVPPLTYQWQRDGQAIEDAINDRLVLENVGWREIGDYSVVVSNSLGAATSTVAPVIVGPVAGWGHDVSGQSSPPHDLADVVAISAGASHNLALRTDGTVVAWGSGKMGQCQVPSDLPRILAIAAGESHSLALTHNRRVITWGGTHRPENCSRSPRICVMLRPSPPGRISVWPCVLMGP